MGDLPAATKTLGLQGSRCRQWKGIHLQVSSGVKSRVPFGQWIPLNPFLCWLGERRMAKGYPIGLPPSHFALRSAGTIGRRVARLAKCLLEERRRGNTGGEGRQAAGHGSDANIRSSQPSPGNAAACCGRKCGVRIEFFIERRCRRRDAATGYNARNRDHHARQGQLATEDYNLGAARRKSARRRS